MNFADIRAAVETQLKSNTAVLEALDLISQHTGLKAQVKKLRVEVASDGETARALKSEIRGLTRKKDAVEGDLSKRLENAEIFFKEEFSLLEGVHAENIRDADAQFAIRKRDHSDRMNEFGRCEHKAEATAKKAEAQLKSLKALLPA